MCVSSLSKGSYNSETLHQFGSQNRHLQVVNWPHHHEAMPVVQEQAFPRNGTVRWLDSYIMLHGPGHMTSSKMIEVK